MYTYLHTVEQNIYKKTPIRIKINLYNNTQDHHEEISAFHSYSFIILNVNRILLLLEQWDAPSLYAFI